MNRAIFLDRDGVIIENRPEYVRTWDDVVIYPHALAALKQLNSTDFMVVIVTNQSAVGRGIISMDAAEEINRRLVDEIRRNGGRLDAVFMCPHEPEANCSCRKPEPGLLLEASRKMDIDLSRSAMIGDAATDLIAADKAGLKELILVRTGRGESQTSKIAELDLPIDTYATLGEAIEDLVSGSWAPKGGMAGLFRV